MKRLFNFPPVSSLFVGASTFGDQRTMNQVSAASSVPLILRGLGSAPGAPEPERGRLTAQVEGAQDPQLGALLPHPAWDIPLADLS